MTKNVVILPTEKPEIEDLPEPRICLRHKVKGGSNRNCPLCWAYDEAENKTEKARKIYVKRPFGLFAGELEAEAKYADLPLFNKSEYEKPIAETFIESDGEFLN